MEIATPSIIDLPKQEKGETKGTVLPGPGQQLQRVECLLESCPKVA